MAYLDPLTRDFVLTRAHDLTAVSNPTLEEMLLRLGTQRGTCFWDLDFGSSLHLLPQEKIGPTTERDVENRARFALKPMIDAKQITGLALKATRVDRNRVDLAGRCSDAGQRPLSFNTFVAV